MMCESAEMIGLEITVLAISSALRTVWSVLMA